MRFFNWKSEPYKILFPTGALAAIIGVALWFLFRGGGLNFYPRQAHASIMYFGFLWAFIAGFLMTAIPKMTQSFPASPQEILVAALLVGLQIFFNFGPWFQASMFCFFVQIVFLLVFVGRRWMMTRKTPFEGFIFLPMAFLQTFLAFGFFCFDASFSMEKFYLLAGEAFVLNLILGLGTRLIPVISRIPNALSPHAGNAGANFKPFLTLGFILNLGFWLQCFLDVRIGYILRLGVVIWMAFKYFKILSRPQVKSFSGYGLRMGILFIIASYFIGVLKPANLLATQHLLYVGGFVLITFMIGTRVMLAHGGESLDYEIKSFRIAGLALLLAFAGLSRFIAGSNLTGYAMSFGILFFCGGILIWLRKFLFKTKI